MSRKTILLGLSGLLLVTGLGAPALAEPAETEHVCLRLDPEGGRDGFCVWLPPQAR